MGVSKGQLYDSKSCECNIVRIQDRHMDKIVDVQNHQGHGAADKSWLQFCWSRRTKWVLQQKLASSSGQLRLQLMQYIIAFH